MILQFLAESKRAKIKSFKKYLLNLFTLFYLKISFKCLETKLTLSLYKRANITPSSQLVGFIPLSFEPDDEATHVMVEEPSPPQE